MEKIKIEYYIDFDSFDQSDSQDTMATLLAKKDCIEKLHRKRFEEFQLDPNAIQVTYIFRSICEEQYSLKSIQRLV